MSIEYDFYYIFIAVFIAASTATYHRCCCMENGVCDALAHSRHGWHAVFGAAVKRGLGYRFF
jgi:hypothetical protein